MKKILYVFILSFGFSLLFITDYKMFAMEFTFNDLFSLSDLGYGLAGGAQFDFIGSKYTVIDPTDDSAVVSAAQSFLADYSIKRGISLTTDPLIETDPYKWLYSYEFGSNVNKEWQNYRLGNKLSEDLSVPLNPGLFGSWANYSKFWYNYYMDSFAIESTDPAPVVIPDNYLYIKNSVDFYSNGISLVYSSLPFARVSGNTYYDTINFQWDKVSYFTDESFDHVPSGSRNFYNRVSVFNGIVTLNFSSDTNKCTYSNYTFMNNITSNTTGNTFEHLQIRGLNNSTYRSCWSYSSRSYSFRTDFSGLSDFLSYAYTHFCNFNLIIDGDLWVEIDDGIIDNVIPDFPDIINPDSDDPAYDIVFPTDPDGAIDLTSLFDAIKQAIIDASDNDDATDGTLSIDDAISKGAVIDSEGVADDTITSDAVSVIDDTSIIDGTKDYPIIPMPDVSSAFSGTTILAELVEATRVSLPEEVDIVFWGVVGVLVFIGLIKILHK